MTIKVQRLAMGTLLALGLTAITACGGSDSTSDTTVATTAPTPVITVSGQWARTSPDATDMGAAYLTVNSDTDDTLVSAMVDSSVAAMAQIHEMVPVENDMSTATTMAGSPSTMMDTSAMTMQEVDHIDVKAGTALELKPGGYHVMLMKLVKPLLTGETFKVTLTFTKAGAVVVDVPVLENAP